MKRIRMINVISRTYLFFSAASLLYVSLMAFFSPQAVMDLVQVQLPNTDAFSSIRGVYGGVGLAVTILLTRWAIRDPQQGVSFLCLFWGLYALSRIITISSEGPLGAFGTQWLIIETVLCAAGGVLLLLRRRMAVAAGA
jgi:hypothetical protein